jgi:hypothetical protein
MLDAPGLRRLNRPVPGQPRLAGMNTEEARVKTGIQQGRDHGDERGMKRARDIDLPQCSVEILRDLGLSTEKIVAYHRRFPTPTPTSCGYRPPASTMRR